jgi:peptidoglycan/LPS O-acetylase OafA/YrhL
MSKLENFNWYLAVFIGVIAYFIISCWQTLDQVNPAYRITWEFIFEGSFLLCCFFASGWLAARHYYKHKYGR